MCACVCVSMCLSCFKSTLHVIIEQSFFKYSPKITTIYSVSSRQIAGSQYAGFGHGNAFRPNLFHQRAEFNQSLPNLNLPDNLP